MTPPLPVRLLRAPASERRQALEAATTLGGVRLALWLLPYRRVRTLFEPRPPVGRGPLGEAERAARVAETTSAIRRGSRVVPAASCLTQAIAARSMLARRDVPSTLRIGVAKSGEARLEAHAWVETAGVVVVGDRPDLDRYARLPDAGAKTSDTSAPDLSTPDGDAC